MVCKAPGLRQRELDAMWRQAEIPKDFLPFTFDTFRETLGDLRARDRIEDWAVHGEGSLFVSGRVGRGKSILCACAMRYRMDVHEVDALYVPAVELLGRIRDTYNRREGDPTEGEVVASATGVGLLLIDDLGTNKPSAHVEEIFYRIINRRQVDHKPTIFTSNLPLDALGHQLGARIAARITRMCDPKNIVEMGGPSLDGRDEAL
jgi:DNA replication protein DnaC